MVSNNTGMDHIQYLVYNQVNKLKKKTNKTTLRLRINTSLKSFCCLLTSGQISEKNHQYKPI